MKKIDLLYNKLLSLLKVLDIELIPNEWEDSHSELVLVNFEKIDEIIEDIKECIKNNKYYNNLNIIKENANSIVESIGDIEGFNIDELKFYIFILSKITAEYAESDISLDDELIYNFAILEIDNEINKNNFIHVSSNIEKNIILFSLKEEEELNDFINSINNIEVLFYLLQGLSSIDINSLKKYILVKSDYLEKKNMIISTLSLSILKEGGSVHYSNQYNVNPCISSCEINIGEYYNQFNDSIDILSEYNISKDLLNKYLRIYHIMENFMYKNSLVKLERDSNSRPFSVRDFQRMFFAIDNSEIESLVKLMKDIVLLDYSTTKKFDSFIFTKWCELTTGSSPLSKSKINEFLRLIDLRTKKKVELDYDGIQCNNISWAIGNLIYKYRNSLVHNRETEFHLTNRTFLDYPIVKEVLIRFLIPVLEEIVFNLISKRNNIVWYQNSKLKLWEE
jgi:hypothetical protein